ncbi:FtsB family cell division protein [Riemerella anatipestifer]|uniref:Septum formation initiator n=1 Tax=Riemerella anatipestifer TaxID=34085 RepID=A0A1A5FLB0_RIEAN|nr:septum formation initiator family protein [Riemerella anatipestifer]AQY22890.1 septum formation initiator [Riemerella anatipestifer]AZZ57654.1 septum formation inhibitor [Riemerella anatipestifer]MBT0571950.1 septum formation initiator family protein [Riemerella anatipestifer]MCO4303799.1 septum formation initiator family protein [Riemerella anatipestifer]MCO7318071.1 septum formation initiator family protein [Riemerella anatipestifer]
MKKLIKDINPTEEPKEASPKMFFFRKYILNKYVITIVAFFVWMTFFDNTSFLVIRDLNSEIKKYEEQLNYYKTEYEKNDTFYKKLMFSRGEKEKFARENYFMKKSNEEIFILVADSTNGNKTTK